jgi:O-antigen ligase
MFLRLLLVFQIFYTVYQDHFNFETGIPGINLPNGLFLVTLFFVFMERETLAAAPHARVKRALLLFYATLIYGFVMAQMRAPLDFGADLTYLKTALMTPLLYLLYLHCKQDQKTTRMMIIVVMAVSAVAAVQAIRQGLDYGIGTFNETHRASGPFGSDFHNANRAGVYYAMFLPMFIAMALFFRRQFMWSLAAYGGIALLSMALLVTYSRQSYFIGLLGLGVLLLRRSIVLAVVLTVVLVSLAGYLPESVTQRVEETRQQDNTSGQLEVDESTASRWEIWTGAMAMWTENPMGVGLNRFKSEIGNYSRYKNFDAHNFYVLTLAELGPIGLFALLWLVWSLFRLSGHMRRSAPKDDAEARALSIGFSVATLCMAVGNLYGSPFLEGPVMGSYWILAGLLERYFSLRQAQEQPAASAATAVAPVDPFARFPLARRALPGRRQ